MLSLNYKSFGQGEPLIILHGLFGTLDNWQTIARKLSEHYLVYLIDQRNHGRSPHDDIFNYETMSSDLKDFMEEHWIHRASVLGHSMGGKAAMQFALDYPDMLDKLIVVDIAPKAYKGGHETIFEALLGLDLSSVESRGDADEKLKQKIEEYGVRQFLLKNLTRQKDGSFAWKMNLPVIHENYQAILGEIESVETFTKPTMFIRGAKSDYIQDEDVKDIEEIFPNSRLETVENAGHWVHAEAPTKLLELVNAFLEE